MTAGKSDLGDCRSLPVQDQNYTDMISRPRDLSAINSNAARGWRASASATTACDYYCATGVICI